ncbi:hypothetical protein [Fluviicola sp.]|uniref:hypothetical protein n=1 Tax=Fluviicola sp. TaxID=1917219 RepID=UPI0026372BC6|nr:hypothetical protein [Fluviicola sp.]
MKLIFIFLLLCSFSGADGNVFICDSPNATAYHYKRDCRGLNNCKHEVKKTTVAEAEKIGLKLCGWED